MRMILVAAVIGILIVFCVGIQRQFTVHDIIAETLFGWMYASLIVLVFMVGNAVGVLIKSLR